MHRLNLRSFRLHLTHSGNYIHNHSYNGGRTKLHSNLVLRDLSKSGRVEKARELFDEMPERDEFTWNTMIVAYSVSGRLADAEKLFRRNPVKNTISWNALISGYCKHGSKDEAFGLFWEMQFDGRRNPNEYSFGSLIRMCASLGLLLRGEQIHGCTVKTGFDYDVGVVNGLLAMYAQCKRIYESEHLFVTMPLGARNNVTWTSMLTGYSRNGFAYKAIECFRDMTRQGDQSNQFTFPSVLTACASVSARRVGVQVHGCIVKSGFKSNIFVQSALIAMYAKCRDLETARALLEGMDVDDDVVSWNSVIVECVREGLEDEALSLFRKMHERDMKIDEFTIPSVLNCFASSSRIGVEIASSVHCLIVKTGYGTYKLMNNALVDMYAKRGIMDSAMKVFERLIEKDVISWTALVTGNTHNGCYEEALKLMNKRCHSKVERVGELSKCIKEGLTRKPKLRTSMFNANLYFRLNTNKFMYVINKEHQHLLNLAYKTRDIHFLFDIRDY